MSDNVHGHKMPNKGITVNPDNPIFGRHQPEVVPAEIPQGLHGAPALRSELEPPATAERQIEEKPTEIAEDVREQEESEPAAS